VRDGAVIYTSKLSSLRSASRTTPAKCARDLSAGLGIANFNDAVQGGDILGVLPGDQAIERAEAAAQGNFRARK